MDEPAQWDGFYIGGFAGANIGDATDGTSSNDFQGYEDDLAIGIQAGVNFDQGDYVWGIEADAGTGLQHGGGSDHTLSAEGLVSIRARLGMKVEDQTLVYATAGLGILFNKAVSSSAGSQNSEETAFRPVLGIGVEHLVTRSISLKAEGLAFIGDDKLYYDSSENDGGKLHNIYSARIGINVHF